MVDDRAGALEIVATVLRAFGFREVHRVTSGEDGIAHLRAHRVDLIIVDLTHGSTQHLTLARFLSESKDPALQQVPMIMLNRPATGTQDSDIDTSGINTGDMGQLTGATLTPGALLDRVANVVGMSVGRERKKRVLH